MPEELVRDHLPIPDRRTRGAVYEDANDPEAKFPPIEPLRPPAGAPNVLIILLDDAGFGAPSAFGRPCATRLQSVLPRVGSGSTAFTRRRSARPPGKRS